MEIIEGYHKLDVNYCHPGDLVWWEDFHGRLYKGKVLKYEYGCWIIEREDGMRMEFEI